MRCWIDFSRILGRFGEALGELLAVLGGSGASPGGVCSQCLKCVQRRLRPGPAPPEQKADFGSQKGTKKEPKRVPRGSQNRDFGSKNVQEAISVHTPFQKRFLSELH